MSVGVPVIGTATGGIPALLEDGAGLLVPERDAAALADALERIVIDSRAQDRAARRRTAARGGALRRRGRRGRARAAFRGGSLMARITVLAQFFPPENNAAARRLEPFLDALARTHEITVTTLRPSYPSPDLYDGGRGGGERREPPLPDPPHGQRSARTRAASPSGPCASRRWRRRCCSLRHATGPTSFSLRRRACSSALPAGRSPGRAAPASSSTCATCTGGWRASWRADRTGRVTGLALRGLERHMWSIVKRADLIAQRNARGSRPCCSPRASRSGRS